MKVLSFKFFAQIVETFAHNVLQRKLRSVGIFGKGEIFRSHLVDAETLHIVDVAGYYGLKQIFRHDVHRHNRIILSAHNHSVAALMPCFFFGMYNTGYQHWLALGATEFPFWQLMLYGLLAVLPRVVVTYAVGLGIEFAFAQWRKEEIQEGFLVTGILIPMICPIETPLWMLAVATAFAVVFAKEVFGGTGYNVVNVALVARAFLFFAYPAQMSGDKVFVATGTENFEFPHFAIGSAKRSCTKSGCRTNIFTWSKGLAAHAAKTECIKVTLES